jgi:hypothetical protein
MSGAVPDPVKVLAAYLQEATAQARLAYGFVPNSYTYSAMQGCLAAEQAFEALRATLAEADGA